MPKAYYPGKRVLLIGASKKVLNRLMLALNEAGFVVTLTHAYSQPEQIFREFTATDFDVVALGRGISTVNKEIIKLISSEQNPKVVFVEGLAPIIPLLVDQIKLACLPKAFPVAQIQLHSDNIHLTLSSVCQLQVKQYHLNWLYMSSENILLDTYAEAGTLVKPLFKRKGFLTISQDTVITHVIPLSVC